MNKKMLVGKSILMLLLAFVFLNVPLFLSAGSIRYWNVWYFNITMFLPMIFFLLYLIKKDPTLLERRMKFKEKEKEQKKIQTIGIFIFLILFVLPGLDFRFKWSHVPTILVILGNIGYLAGYLFAMRVLLENSYASRVIEVVEGQKVISSGPYAVIRHPMYIGVLIMYFFLPIALGSYYTLIAFIPMPIHIVLRIKNEEKVLEKELAGYKEYKEKVKYRLIPRIW
jgi:protein-S-isoprenylcysteine O-methyltransferase Ste14